MPPELAAVRIPGIGHELMRRFGVFPNLAVWAVVVRAEAEGTVRPAWGGRDKVKLSLTARDIQRARKGTAILARMMFEAGAREVWPGIYGLPSVLTSIDEVRLIEEAPLDSAPVQLHHDAPLRRRPHGRRSAHQRGRPRLPGVTRRGASTWSTPASSRRTSG